jgi:DNA polymerase (family X)
MSTDNARRITRMGESDGATQGHVSRPRDLENPELADKLEAFAALLDLAGANPYGVRAYRRAAALVRATPASVAGLVRSGRARELRGIGRGIEGKLRELVQTGEIAELVELERTVSPQLVGLGRLVGLNAKRAAEIGRVLGIRTADELRQAAREGRLTEVPGIGPKTAERIRAALDRSPEVSPPRSLPLNRSRPLVEAVAAALGGTAAGDPRRWRDASERLAVVCSGDDANAVTARFEEHPSIVAIVERTDQGALGVTVDGIPIELVVAPPAHFGTELLRATGSKAYVDALEPLPAAPDEAGVYHALGLPFCPPELREEPYAGEPPTLLELSDIRGDLHCHTTWSDGRASVLEMGAAARDRGYEYLAICDHTLAVRVVPGLDAEAIRRQGEEIAAANEVLAPFRVLRGAECDILPDGSLDLPDDVLSELEWVMASLHAGQRRPRRELTRQVVEAVRNPFTSALSHPTGRLINHRPPNALDLDEVFAAALETGTALEVNGLPDRLDLNGENVRRAIAAGVRIVVSTDAHSVVGLANMELAVATARRGGATAADAVNTRPLSEVL